MVRTRWFLPAVVCAVLLAATALYAITTVEVRETCPICGTRNDFYSYASWGGYIYGFPSKYQLVFFPATSSATFYTCKRCHYSVYLWDWNKLPKEKTAAVKDALKDVKLSGNYKKYTDIPTSERMLIAEKVYRVLEKGDDFWEQFYRVLGYHFEAEHKPGQSAEARIKALSLTQKRLDDPARKGERKDALVVAAALHHFLKEDATAQNELQEAAQLTFAGPKGERESQGYDQYLTNLIKEYQERIKAGTVPDSTSPE